MTEYYVYQGNTDQRETKMNYQDVKMAALENLDGPEKIELMKELLDSMIMSGQIGEPGSYSENLASNIWGNLVQLGTVVRKTF